MACKTTLEIEAFVTDGAHMRTGVLFVVASVVSHVTEKDVVQSERLLTAVAHIEVSLLSAIIDF